MATKAKILKSLRPAKWKTQQHNRCKICGRPRAYIRKFEMCRICFRRLSLSAQIPGVRKSSW